MASSEIETVQWFDSEGNIVCPNCGHKWPPRTKGKIPKQCPSCKRYLRTLTKGGDSLLKLKAEMSEMSIRLERVEQTVFKTSGRTLLASSKPSLCLGCMEFQKDKMVEHCLPVKLGLVKIPSGEEMSCKYFEDLSKIARNGGEK